MLTHIKSEAQPRAIKIQAAHWDSKIGLNEYINRTASSSPQSTPSPPPTLSISRSSTPSPSNATDQDDDLLLHPPPRTATIALQSRKALRAALRADPKAKDWRPDNTIRLLPAIAHIKIDVAAGITLDPRQVLPPAVPKRERKHLEARLLEVGLINDQLPRTGLIDASKAWRTQMPKLVPVFMWIKPETFHGHQYDVVDSDGDAVDEEYVMWNEGLETAEERREAIDDLQQSAVLEMEQIDREFRERAREYRRERVEWEISLVKNEWVKRKNCSLFRPGTTVWMVHYAMRLGRGNLEREEGQVDGNVHVGTLGAISPEVEREIRGSQEEEWDDGGFV
ncbi:hypothetical protein OEA41_007044 [Lepraria neglecta]|uniref:Uncharacterized protein n=1 Tax=Lepraria neglecta TaxID=209136 RepID=A0AAE0DKT8_9LECA|nr:hypothetical protein OEA41_007044 [Lepraria neglecta]